MLIQYFVHYFLIAESLLIFFESSKMIIYAWTLDSLGKLQKFSRLPILFWCILFKLVSTSIINKSYFLSLYPYNVSALIKFYLLIYLLKSASHWSNSIFFLNLYFYCLLICYISFHFFNYKKDPRFLFCFVIWIFAFYTFLIKLNCLMEIFAHIFCIVIHLIIKKLNFLVVSFVYIQLFVIEFDVLFVLFSNIVLAFLNFLAKNSHSACNSIEFN